MIRKYLFRNIRILITPERLFINGRSYYRAYPEDSQELQWAIRFINRALGTYGFTPENVSITEKVV